MHWFPFLSPPDMTPIPNRITNFNEPQVAGPSHSHPPGFESKGLPQAINQGKQEGYSEYPLEGLQTQMPGALSIQPI